MKAVVVIPIYSPEINPIEEASLRQCLKILYNHDISFITYRELNTNCYTKICSEFNNAHIKYEYFDKSHFNGINSYNRFCLNAELYNRFFEYDYMLIYQLDAWVFSDQLIKWCQQGYDYIGPPLFNDWSSNYPYFIEGCNGGFSLRKINFFLSLLNSSKRIHSFKQIWNQSHYFSDYIKFIPRILLGLKRTPLQYIKKKLDQGFNEDIIISIFLRNTQFTPNIPSAQIATNFAFEKYPTILYKKNKNQLPFGCHAFMKYEYNLFWSKFIHINDETLNNNNKL